MLVFLIIVLLDVFALYLTANRIDADSCFLKYLYFVNRKNLPESMVCLGVLMLYLPFTIFINIKHLFKK